MFCTCPVPPPPPRLGRFVGFGQRWQLAALTSLLWATTAAMAQVAITSITTTTNTSAANSTETGTNPTTLTYQNDIRSISNFVAGGTSYYVASSATSVAVRRNAVNSNNSSMWVTDVSATQVVGTDVDSYGALLLDNNIFQGADNVFSNGTGVSQGNIERIDFLWNSGVTVLTTDGITVFERGLVNAHDPFQVALITSLGSGVGSPLTWTFGNVLEVASTNYGSTNLDLDNNGSVDTIDYRLLRFGAGDTLTSHTAATETGSQGLGGTFISFASLGLTTSTTIYGYAIMGSDVTNTSASLADWTNATFYPTNTADANGGLDMAAFNGRISRVPEPGHYGAMLLGTSGLFWAWRRWRRSATIPTPSA